MGIAGVVLAPVMLIVVRDRARGRTASAPPASAAVFAILAPQAELLAARLSLHRQLAVRLRSRAVDAVGADAVFGFDLIKTGQFLGSLFLIGGMPGVFPGGSLADRLGRRDRGWYAWLPAIAWAITVPTFAVGLLTPQPVGGVAAAPDPQRAQHPLAGAVTPRSSTSRPGRCDRRRRPASC